MWTLKNYKIGVAIRKGRDKAGENINILDFSKNKGILHLVYEHYRVAPADEEKLLVMK